MPDLLMTIMGAMPIRAVVKPAEVRSVFKVINSKSYE